MARALDDMANSPHSGNARRVVRNGCAGGPTYHPASTSSTEPSPRERPRSSSWFIPAALSLPPSRRDTSRQLALQSSPSADDIVTDAGAPAPSKNQPLALRAEAAKAIDQKEWTTCIELLDAEAKELDPAGDDTPAVQNARRLARRGRGPKLPRHEDHGWRRGVTARESSRSVAPMMSFWISLVPS